MLGTSLTNKPRCGIMYAFLNTYITPGRLRASTAIPFGALIDATVVYCYGFIGRFACCSVAEAQLIAK